ncbi:MAG: hypothetical protein IJ875_03985 [Solobacterium sp.]|nr:hypothetical protein [Solobacterium sp.]
MLNEQEWLVENIECKDTICYGLHPSNVVRLFGILPKDKARLIEEIQKVRNQLNNHLDDYPIRMGEGMIVDDYNH